MKVIKELNINDEFDYEDVFAVGYSQNLYVALGNSLYLYDSKICKYSFDSMNVDDEGVHYKIESELKNLIGKTVDLNKWFEEMCEKYN